MAQTNKIFQLKHQDTISALELLAHIDIKERKPIDAQAHASAALETAVAVFGGGAGGTKSPKSSDE